MPKPQAVANAKDAVNYALDHNFSEQEFNEIFSSPEMQQALHEFLDDSEASLVESNNNYNSFQYKQQATEVTIEGAKKEIEKLNIQLTQLFQLYESLLRLPEKYFKKEKTPLEKSSSVAREYAHENQLLQKLLQQIKEMEGQLKQQQQKLQELEKEQVEIKKQTDTVKTQITGIQEMVGWVKTVLAQGNTTTLTEKLAAALNLTIAATPQNETESKWGTNIKPSMIKQKNLMTKLDSLMNQLEDLLKKLADLLTQGEKAQAAIKIVLKACSVLQEKIIDVSAQIQGHNSKPVNSTQDSWMPPRPAPAQSKKNIKNEEAETSSNYSYTPKTR